LYEKATGDGESGAVFGLCAVGSLDNSISLWSTLSPYPIAVLKGISQDGTMDISWYDCVWRTLPRTRAHNSF